jgi:hypothetical protein
VQTMRSRSSEVAGRTCGPSARLLREWRRNLTTTAPTAWIRRSEKYGESRPMN